MSALSPTALDSGTAANSSAIFSGVAAIGAFDSGVKTASHIMSYKLMSQQ